MSASELFSSPPEAPKAGNESVRGESQSLYRKHRPQSFAETELVGQEHIVQTLRNAITLDRVAHAYLFCGPRGTGKTTTARLLAKAVNCLDPDPYNRPCNACSACVAITTGATTDVIEIDAASNRGIDDIRDLRERVKYAPTQLQTKFYIIDEAHQITGAAANAFLKTLEEPPAHTRFVLATTDPEELLQTIVSRCQRFDFRRITLDAMVSRLQTVVDREGLQADKPALEAIARHATGSLRDALGLLDQLSVYQEEPGETGDRQITVESVRTLLGISRNDRISGLIDALADRDAAVALELINASIDAGEDARQLNRQLVTWLRELMFVRAGARSDADEASRKQAERFSVGELSALARLFSEIDFKIKRSIYGQLPLEIAVVEAITRGAIGESPAAAAQPSERRTRPEPAPRDTPAPIQGQEPIADRPATNRLAGRIRQSAPGRQIEESPTGHDKPLDVAPPPGIARGQPSAESVREPSTPSERPPVQAVPRAEVSGGVSVDRLAEQWNQIKLDVKSVDRRVEALLAASDPYDVAGSEIRLVTPYDFHAKKLNEEGPRSLVAEVIGRLFGQRVFVTAYQVGHTPPKGETAREPESEPEPAAGRSVEPLASSPRDDHDAPPPLEPDINASAILEERTKTAMSIFDAVPVEPPAKKPKPSG